MENVNWRPPLPGSSARNSCPSKPMTMKGLCSDGCPPVGQRTPSRIASQFPIIGRPGGRNRKGWLTTCGRCPAPPVAMGFPGWAAAIACCTTGAAVPSAESPPAGRPPGGSGLAAAVPDPACDGEGRPGTAGCGGPPRMGCAALGDGAVAADSALVPTSVSVTCITMEPRARPARRSSRTISPAAFEMVVSPMRASFSSLCGFTTRTSRTPPGAGAGTKSTRFTRTLPPSGTSKTLVLCLFVPLLTSTKA
mmetsp:Transcript_87470/g.195854  ORF Transcript_87470/g.195854 Transcript_87470/m.195854 type:complete len:250 (-) Transcript_87470:118-867(-)